MAEQSKDEKTLAASLLNIGIGESVISILGAEYSENLGDLFGKNSFLEQVQKRKQLPLKLKGRLELMFLAEKWS